MAGYSPEDYWARLHGERSDETAVGYPELPASLNRAMYAALVDQADRVLRRHGVVPAPGQVLDVGSGTGVWIDFWRDHGAREVVGSDLAQAAVARLRALHRELRIEQVDIGADDPGIEGPFDVVSAMSVLLHIVDDARWQRALTTLAGLVRPGGHVVLIEPYVVHRWWGPPFTPEANSRARTASEWDAALLAAGLELVDVRPATVLLANVADTRSRRAFAALWLGWGLLQRAVGGDERRGQVAGRVLGALDAPLRRVMPHGPSAKLLVLRRSAP